ncbi:BMP family lipoprotein [Succinimonas amylolytica]|uniref:BMP family lipoprotein n=1 Tax=Succinimonas amylolytica TaxID=83769 RepID=UPI0023A8AA9A
MKNPKEFAAYYQIQAIMLSLIVMGLAILILFYCDFKTKVVIEDALASKQKVMVMLLVNGFRGDSSWADAHIDGLLDAVNHLGLQSEIHDNVNYQKCVNYIDRFVEATHGKGGLIMAPSYEFTVCANEKSLQYPQYFFAGIFDDRVEQRPNLFSYSGKMHNIRYITGILAGYAVDSPEFGFIASERNPETYRDVNAFAMGLRYVRPDARVHVVMANTWHDHEQIQDAIRRLYHRYPQIQAITHSIDTDDVDFFCYHAGILCISYGSNGGHYYRENSLAEASWRWGVYYKHFISSVNEGMFQAGSQWVDFQSGNTVIRHVNYKLLPDRALTEMDKIVNLMVQSRFDVFSGPIYDNNGELRVKRGEKLDPLYIMYSIDWFVEGVDEL